MLSRGSAQDNSRAGSPTTCHNRWVVGLRKEIMYKEDLTQEERILELLRERGSTGVEVYEFMMPQPKGGLGVAQYNARIWGLRKKGYDIKNEKPGHFVLIEENPVQGMLI